MPVLTPQQLQELPTRLEKLTQKFEDSVIEDICRRIAQMGAITDTAEYQLLRMKELGYSNDFLKKAIADYTEKSKAEVQWMFFEIAQISDEFYEDLYLHEGKPFIPWDENPYMQQWLSAGIAQTNDDMYNFTQSMGFAIRNADGTTSFKYIAEAYQDALDLAHMQVSTGAMDYNTAIRRAIQTLTDSGLCFVTWDKIDENGVKKTHKNHLDVAARRAVLTGIGQMTGKISEQNAAELETDIVEVTAHAGARPDHALWQGGWYSLSGKSKEYKSLEKVTGYGTGAGLKGWNCHHDFYPVIPGYSVPTYTKEELENIDPDPIEYNGKTLTYYECTQMQRKMETAMRKTKRQIMGFKAAGDEDMFTAKSVKLRLQQEQYKEFSKKANLLTQNERTQVYGFDRSIASKASWAARKAEKTA